MNSPAFTSPVPLLSHPLLLSAVGRSTRPLHPVVPHVRHNVPAMGLNAKNLAKNKKKGGKKKGKSASRGSATSTQAPPRANAHKVDTNRKEYIYQMVGVNKTLDNGKQILKNINLSYFPGVKIGVVGENGSGKR